MRWATDRWCILQQSGDIADIRAGAVSGKSHGTPLVPGRS